ncbi:MAG: hypothetical protein GY719_28760 [bacterium]|nr:hypothetical protein [bacterium]
MSLINEALKRARIDAARRDAAQKGVPAAALPVYVPARRRSWLAPVIGFLLGLTVVAVAAGAFWIAWQPGQERPGQEPSQPAPPAAAVAEPVTPPAPATPAPEMRRIEAPADVPSPAPPPPAAAPPPPRAAEPRPEPAAVAEQREASPVEESPGAGTPAALPPADGGETGSGEVFAVEANPAGGERVKLDFIVWSETRPFAQINGELVNPGQQVAGYILVTVERDRVELEGAGKKFWLRVR